MTPASTQGKPGASNNISPVGLRTGSFPKNALNDARLSKRALRVLVALSTFTNRNTGQCWPAQATLGEILGMNRRKVSKIISDELVPLGYIATLGRRNRKLLYQMMQPDFTPYHMHPTGDAQDNSDHMHPTGGAQGNAAETTKCAPRGMHEHAPSGDAQTQVNKNIKGLRTPDSRSPDGSLTGEAFPKKGPDGLSTGKEGKKSFSPSSRRPETEPPYSPLTRASQSLCREDAAKLLGMSMRMPVEKALEYFGFDYAGRKIEQNPQIDLDECIANTPGKATKPKTEGKNDDLTV